MALKMTVLEKLIADLAKLDKDKVELDKKRLELTAAIANAKAAAEPTYLNEIGKIVGGEIKITSSGSYYTVKKGTATVASFSLQQLHGCCGVCVSHNAMVSAPFQKKGLGTLLNKVRQQIAFDAKYTILLCTDKESNKPQQKILDKNGWTKLLTFKNRKTNNSVCIHAIMLKDTGLKIGGKLQEPAKV